MGVDFFFKLNVIPRLGVCPIVEQTRFWLSLSEIKLNDIK